MIIIIIIIVVIFIFIHLFIIILIKNCCQKFIILSIILSIVSVIIIVIIISIIIIIFKKLFLVLLLLSIILFIFRCNGQGSLSLVTGRHCDIDDCPRWKVVVLSSLTNLNSTTETIIEGSAAISNTKVCSLVVVYTYYCLIFRKSHKFCIVLITLESNAFDFYWF